MKQIILTILTASIIHFSGFSQHQVTPAVGVGNVKIGMPVDSIIKIIGKPGHIVSYKNEKKAWEDCGYKPAVETVFSFSFDKVYVFDNGNSHAIWKIYSNHDTAVIFNICKLVKGIIVPRDVALTNGPGFNDDTTAIVKYMGSNYSKVPNKNDNFVYREQGISFVMIDGKINNMFIYQAGDGRQGPAVKDVVPPCSENENMYVMADAPVVSDADLKHTGQ